MPQNELTGKPVRRGEAALHLWSHAIRGEPEVRSTLGAYTKDLLNHVRRSCRGLAIGLPEMQAASTLLMPQREEIFKTGCIPNLLSMLERGDTDDKFAAIGAITVLARSEKHITEVISSKVR